MSSRVLLRRFLPLVFASLACVGSSALAHAEKKPAIKSGSVKTPDGIRIHYLEAGTGANPLVRACSDCPSRLFEPRPRLLFVPGWTMPAEIWEKQIAYFAKDYRVVAIDPRAQGESTKTAEGLYPAARARDIKAVVDQLKLAPVVLVGWSMGVNEAAAYVDRFGTNTLAGLVLVDGIAGADFDPTFTPAMLKLAGSFLKDRQKVTESFVRGMYKTPQSEEYIHRVIQASLRMPTNSAVALFVGMITSDNRPALTKINKPTLIVFAPGGPWDSVYEDMHKRIAGSRLETIDNAGHALFADQPERFNSLLADFLNSLE